MINPQTTLKAQIWTHCMFWLYVCLFFWKSEIKGHWPNVMTSEEVILSHFSSIIPFSLQFCTFGLYLFIFKLTKGGSSMFPGSTGYFKIILWNFFTEKVKILLNSSCTLKKTYLIWIFLVYWSLGQGSWSIDYQKLNFLRLTTDNTWPLGLEWVMENLGALKR